LGRGALGYCYCSAVQEGAGGNFHTSRSSCCRCIRILGEVQVAVGEKEDGVEVTAEREDGVEVTEVTEMGEEREDLDEKGDLREIQAARC